MIKIILSESKYLIGLGLISPIAFLLNTQIVFLFCFIYCVLIFKKERETRLREIIKCTVSFIKICPIIYILSILSKLILYEFEEQDKVVELKRNFSENLVYNIITITMIAPIIEETIFRGLFYRSIKNLMPVSFSIIITSLIFSIIHQNILSFVILFFLSGYLTYIYERYGNIIYPIIVHSIFNSIMLFLIYLDSYV